MPIAVIPGVPKVGAHRHGSNFRSAFGCDRVELSFGVLLLAIFILAPPIVSAGGPKYVAGVSYFNPSALGQPVRWVGGQVRYYVDQGPLNATITNQQATAMVDAAAALWSAVPTAGVKLTDTGPLNEDVSGANILVNGAGQITAPADVTPSATNYPLAVIYDADGSVTDAVFGTTTSAPTACQNNGVQVWLDNLNPDATIAHAVILLNGLCATNARLVQMMSYELERAFGRVLGLDYSQTNPGALASGEVGGTQGWPVMHPLSGVCGPSGGECIPNASVLRYDDIAALNRIYPITAANLAAFPGKQITAANTISIQGTVAFRGGYPMQGVNVVARPLDASGNPLYQYTVSSVSGANFNGDHGNPVTGYKDNNGDLLSQWGSSDTHEQGAFDLSGILLPPGVTTANYQISFESIDPLYILTDSVGPYTQGQVSPSGMLAPVTLSSLSAGSSRTIAIAAADSATGGYQDAIGIQSQPRTLSSSGFWMGRLSQVGQTDWFTFPVRGGRTFSIVTQALDESGAPTESKAMPSIGIWDAFDPIGTSAVGAAPGLNGLATGETWLRVTASGDDMVRIGVADLRGDGRPDYAYKGFVLYADTVEPARLPASGGAITIRGMGFRLADTVLVGGQTAVVTSISPNEITAIAPAAKAGVTGSVDVEVDDDPMFYAAAIVSGGVSYDAATGDALTLNSAPMNTVPIGEPLPFAVTAYSEGITPTGSLAPAGGVTIVYTVTSGTAQLACGQPVCTVTATGDGRATLNVTAVDGSLSVVTASLLNGSQVQAHFAGGTPPVLASLNPQLSLASGVNFLWTVQALVLNKGLPVSGQTVTWTTQNDGIAVKSSTSGAVLGSGSATTNASGIANQTLSVGPLDEGQTATIKACLNGTSQCVMYTAFGARAEFATLMPVSGTEQTLGTTGTPGQIVMRLYDMDGNPMAGGTVALYQALYAWTPPCGAHAACTNGALLGTQSGIATSALDGSVNFTPASMPGVATELRALAVAGNSSTVSITVEQRP